MTAELLELQSAHAAVARYVRQRSRTFQYATLLLPAERRQAMWAAYAFFRQMDDMVDRAKVSPDAFHQWRRQALELAANQQDPILRAWAAVRERYAVDDRYVRDLLDGIEADLAPRRFGALDDLYAYCRQVAETVGLMATPIMGLAPGITFEQAAPYAAALSRALQMTNILRDLGEDLSEGRIYVPQSELVACGLTLADIESRVCDERFHRLVRRMIALTRRHFAQGWPGLALLSRTGRWTVGLGALTYRAILDRMERAPCSAYGPTPRVSLVGKLWLLATSWPDVAWPGRVRTPDPAAQTE